MSILYKNILIAIDGSEPAKKALLKAIDIAKIADSTLILTYIIDIREYPRVIAYEGALAKHAENNARTLLANYEKKAKGSGLSRVKTIIEHGSPRAVITRTIAPNEKVDLIVIGATGLGKIKHFLVGSVSESVIRHAKCDVLVIR